MSTIKEQFLALDEEMRNTESADRQAEIFDQMVHLLETDREEAVAAYAECLHNFKLRVDQTYAKQSMDFVTSYLSMSLIAKNYFGKSRAWMSQKLNGHIVNGKPAKFTDEELATLKRALNEIGSRLVQISENL